MNNFETLGIGEAIVRAIAEIGYETPTPIQEQSIPVLLEGNRDFIGLAQTGTGKTAAFSLPLLELIDFDSKTTQALILAPTRELCMQITNEIVNFSKYIGGVRTIAVYGGASIQTQISDIKKGAHIIVATPGRLLDLISRNAVNITNVSYVVLDEADEMLNMGFKEDLDHILGNTPTDKATWLFSATMSKEVSSIARNYMNNPFELTVGKKNTTADKIEHLYYVVHARDRYNALKRIVDVNPDIFAIVFCRTRIETQEITEKLIKDGYNADSLHGDLSQAQRDKVMNRYRERSLQLLVATDVAARGIDVNDVTHVINYNLPDELENYTHRSGRTARVGKSGISVCIINTKEVGKIRQLERLINLKFTLGHIPTGVEVCETQLMGMIKKIHNVPVDESGIAKYMPAIFEELKDLDKEELIKRFVSLEFNRFLDYYRNSNDLNADASKRDGESAGQSRGAGEQMFINLGEMDGFDTGKMLGYLIEVTGLDKAAFGRINVKPVFTFIDITPEFAPAIEAAFKGETFNGRRLRVDLSGESKSSRGGGNGGFERGGSRGGDRGGDRGGFRNDRAPRTDYGQRDDRPRRQYSDRGGDNRSSSAPSYKKSDPNAWSPENPNNNDKKKRPRIASKW